MTIHTTSSPARTGPKPHLTLDMVTCVKNYYRTHLCATIKECTNFTGLTYRQVMLSRKIIRQGWKKSGRTFVEFK